MRICKGGSQFIFALNSALFKGRLRKAGGLISSELLFLSRAKLPNAHK